MPHVAQKVSQTAIAIMLALAYCAMLWPGLAAAGDTPTEIKVISSQFYAPQKDQILDIDNLTRMPEFNWQTAKSNYGFTKNAVYLRATVKITNGDGSLYSLSIPMLADYGEMWVTEGVEILAHSLSGSMVPREKWTSARTFTGIDIHANGDRTLVVYGIIKHSARLIAQPSIEATDKKIEREGHSRIIWYLFLGASLILLVHNLGLFFAAREAVFVSYIAFITVMVVSLSGVWGASSGIIASTVPEWADKIRVFHAMTTFVIVQMVESYIERNNLSNRVNICLDAFKMIIIMVVLGAFFDADTMMSISAVLSIIMVPLIYVAAINAIARGNKHAWYVIASVMGPTITFFFNHMILLAGREPPAKELLTLGFMLEGTVMSFAMSDRVRRLRNKVLENATRQNEILEKMVAERTAKLKSLYDSLSIEVKERREAEAIAEQRSQIIKEQQSQLLVAARSQAVSNLSIGISHEINNPLAIAQGNVFIIEQKIKAREPVDQSAIAAVTSAHKAIVRIAQIVKSLRDFTELMKPNTIEAKPASSVFEMVPKSVSNDAGIAIPINVEYSDLRCDIRMDGFAFGQILKSLLSNAANAVAGDKNGWILFSGRVRNGVIEFLVTDSGQGINHEIAEHMFDPFFTTGAPTNHKGLGLTSARILSESMGGSLTYDSQAKHTTFIVSLPVSATAAKLTA